MTQNLHNKDKQALIILVSNRNATIIRISKLYLKLKTEHAYLKRRYKIVEDRLNYVKKKWEKKIGCNITFDGIDDAIKRENTIKKRKRKNDNTKNERL